MVHTQHGILVKKVRTDNGPEFCMANFFSSKGIIHQKSCVETPQQNSIVERKHQHIMNVTRALLFQANLPKSFWSFAVLHAIFLINRTPTPTLENASPYEILHNKTPDFSFLKVFGCLAYASSLSRDRTKLGPKAHKCVFL